MVGADDGERIGRIERIKPKRTARRRIGGVVDEWKWMGETW